MEKQVSWRMASGTGSYWSDAVGGKAARQRVDGPFVSSCRKRGFIYSHNSNTIVRRNDRRKWPNAWLQREMHYSFFFCFFLRPSVAETLERRLPRCQHLTPDVFFCPRCLSQTKRKINKAFSPPISSLMQLQKANGRSSRGPKEEGKKSQRYETSSEWKYRGKTSPYTLKMLLTSEPQVAKPMRQGAQGWTNISFYY